MQTKVYLRLLPFEKQNDTEAFYVDVLCELMAALLSINHAPFSYDAIIRGVLLREWWVVRYRSVQLIFFSGTQS